MKVILTLFTYTGLPFIQKNLRIMKVFSTLAVLTLLSGFMIPNHALAKAAKIHEYSLENGLKVLVMQDNRAPIVVSQIWYKVGSSYEYGGITGVSHILEHMMFKGTKKYPTGQFETIMAENGATNNAFTSRDYTAYYEVMAKDRLEISFEIEADRMRNLKLTQKEFEKELEVVKEERRWRTDDQPTALTREHFNATAFLNSPYASPVVGWMVDLDSMKLDDLQQWYQQWYAPNNATLVVVGDVVPDDVYALAKKHFSAIEPSDIKPVKPRTEVMQKGQRDILVKAPAKVPHLRMGYKVPGMNQADENWEPYALEVLANILDGGRSARFSKTLVREKEVAVAAGASYYGYGRLSDLFVMSGTPREGVSIDTLKQSMLDEIKKLKDEKIDASELKRVKAQVIAGEVYERDSIEHMATLLGSLSTTGIGYQLMNDYVPAILKVTPEQVQAVAKKYLVDDVLTVAQLVPEKIDSKPARKTSVIKE